MAEIFTKAQKELFEKAINLEKQYGRGNVFLRYINDCWRIRFVIHEKGARGYKTIFQPHTEANGRVVNTLERKGYIEFVNSMHQVMQNKNNYAYDAETDTWCIGGRLKTEEYLKLIGTDK